MEEISPKLIVGYADRRRVRPGETIHFMVRAHDTGHYHGRVVRMPDRSGTASPIDDAYPARCS